MKAVKTEINSKNILNSGENGCGCGCQDSSSKNGNGGSISAKTIVKPVVSKPFINMKTIEPVSCSDPAAGKECCPGPEQDISRYEQIPYTGTINTASGAINVVPDKLNLNDWLGTLKARMNINRNNYMVKPGVYAVGKPDSSSPVLVSANYKLSFDHLRRNLKGIDAWIMVIDTKGINVWCAAGKGTFGTDEIINRIRITSLDTIVGHRKIILPQLGAPGVAAHVVAKGTGFKPVYGPVRAADIGKFLESGMKADREMRRVRFGFIGRLVLIPVEVSIALKYMMISLLLFLLLSGIDSSGFSINNIMKYGLKSVTILLLAFFMGTAITPLLLPYIPGRAFSFKGLVTGVILFIALYGLYPGFAASGYVELSAWLLLTASITSFFTMNFTGSTTYTSLSGVMKEMKVAVPVQAVAAAAGIVLFIISRFI